MKDKYYFFAGGVAVGAWWGASTIVEAARAGAGGGVEGARVQRVRWTDVCSAMCWWALLSTGVCLTGSEDLYVTERGGGAAESRPCIAGFRSVSVGVRAAAARAGCGWGGAAARGVVGGFDHRRGGARSVCVCMGVCM